MRTIVKYSTVANVIIGVTLVIFIIMQKNNTSPQTSAESFYTHDHSTFAKLSRTPAEPMNLIGNEDVLHIWVRDEPELDRKVSVDSVGSIRFPLVGDIQATGRTLSEVKDEIHSKVLRYVPNAEVTVSVFKSPH